jgi:hypothetical protein
MMVLMGIGVKGKYSAEWRGLDNSDQIAAITERLVGVIVMEWNVFEYLPRLRRWFPVRDQADST